MKLSFRLDHNRYTLAYIRPAQFSMSTQTEYAYERLAGALADQVRRGTLAPGERIPSVREMSGRHGVSVTTVLQAYRKLEALHLVEARPKSGFYVLPERAHRVPPPRVSTPAQAPTTVTTSDLMDSIVASSSDRGLVPLGAAIPDPALLPLRALARQMGTVLREDAAAASAYGLPNGAGELRREIAKREWNVGPPVGPDDVCITCGASEGLSLAIRATTEPGDVIAVESPAFFGTLQAIEASGRRALEIPTCSVDGIEVDALASALEKHDVRACIVTPNFHNPLGSLMPDSEKERLVRTVGARGIALIEDDTFGELYFGEQQPPSLRSWDTEGLVLRIGSFSKTLAPGYRVGWIVPGPRYEAAVRRHKLASTVATATPPQLAVARYLAGGRYDHHLRKLRRILGDNVARLRAEVAARFPEGTRLSRPRGGFLLWVRLPGEADALALFARARARGISLSPGVIFSPSDGFRRFIRLSAGHPWTPRTEAAIDALAEIVRSDA